MIHLKLLTNKYNSGEARLVFLLIYQTNYLSYISFRDLQVN